MAGPTINIPISSEGLARIGDYKAAAKAARQEVKALKAEATEAAASLGQIPTDLQNRLVEAQNRHDNFSKKAKEQLSPREMAHEFKMYSHLAKAQAVKSLLTGEGGIQEALMLAESRKLRTAMAKAGLGGVASVLGAVAPYALAATAIYESGKHIIEAVEKDRKEARQVGREYGAGYTSNEELEYFQKREEITDDAREQYDKMEKATKEIAERPIEEREEILSKALLATRIPNIKRANKMMLEQSREWSKQDVETINNLIAKHTLEREKELHKALNKEETEAVIRESIATYLNHFLNNEQANLFVNKLLDAIVAVQKTKPVDESATVAYLSKQREKNHSFIQHARDKRFAAAESFSQVLWVGE
jgi:hypothetical protein